MSKDARFAKLASDPRFIKPKKVAQKVQVDERFANLLDNAKSEKRVDKRGRRVNASKAEKEDLKRFYKVQEEEQQPEASTSKHKDAATAGMSAGERALKMARGEILEQSSDESSSEDEAEAELESDGDSALEGQSDSASEGDSEFSIDLAEDPDEEAADFPDDQEAGESETEEDIDTKRLALVNMDWDHIRAVDLFKVLQSALQVTHVQGSVKRVSIYPSEFGKERMEREEREGPPRELFATEEHKQDLADLSEDDVDEKMVVQEAEDKGEEINSKALRRYQLERLRYYYAVAEFDSVKSARAAFMEVQGTEFERSANIFELRAIPDDMQFEDKPKETATSTDDHSAYEGGLDYVTTALRHSKVKLTWDQDDPRRSRVTRIDLSKMPKDKLDQINYADYLASDSSEESAAAESEDEEAGGKSRAAQFRAALGLSAEHKKSKKSKGPAGDMEITFRPALEGGHHSGSESDEGAQERDETTIEKYKRKEKERRERKKQARRAAEGEGEEVQDGEGEQEDDFFEGFPDEDQAFAEALAAHDAGIDDLSHQKQQSSKKLSKAAKRAAKAKEAEEAAKKRAELELLVDEKDDAKHFDMDKIWKAEREEAGGGASRSAKRKRGARAAKKEAEVAQAKAQDQFVLDAKDDRFKNLHEDPAFAIDPSNPRYKKTKNMQLLLDETRKARDTKVAAAGANTSESRTASAASRSNGAQGAGGQEKDLDSLVSAIKRKSDSAKDKKSKKRKL